MIGNGASELEVAFPGLQRTMPLACLREEG